MEAQYRTRDGRLIVKVQAEKPKDLFRQIATAQEIFEAESNCGICKSDRVHFRVRSVDALEFYELHCGACGARFEFGQHRNGLTLFPKRRDENGPLPNGGWAKWEPKQE